MCSKMHHNVLSKHPTRVSFRRIVRTSFLPRIMHNGHANNIVQSFHFEHTISTIGPRAVKQEGIISYY